MTALEWVATAFGLACVVFTIFESIWCWPTGLVQVLLYAFVFYKARLYSDVILHVIYVALQVYGWYAWLHGGAAGGALKISRLPAVAWIAWIVVAVTGAGIVGGAMARFTNTSRPFWDASVLVVSLIAQWLMARKVLESWVFWMAVDVLAIGLYAVKGLYPTTGLYAVFLVLAIAGFFKWQQSTTQAAVPQPA